MFALATTILLAAAVPTTVVTHVDDFDLAKVPRQTAGCADRDPSGDIVVCAPKGMNFSIPDVRRFVEKPVRATFVGPLKAEATVHAIKTENPFAATPAAAVTFNWHF